MTSNTEPEIGSIEDQETWIAILQRQAAEWAPIAPTMHAALLRVCEREQLKLEAMKAGHDTEHQ